MRKKFLYAFLISVLAVFALSACSSSAPENNVTEPSVSEEISADSTAEMETAEDTETEEKIEIAVDEENEKEDAEISESENEKPFEQDVLYRADFEIPDCRGLGYTNLVDFYNDYPNGKPGGTFGNAGLLVHYRDDIDMDMTVEESL